MLVPTDFDWNPHGGAPDPRHLLQAGGEIVYASSGTLTFQAQTHPVFDFHWLRETALGALGGSLGTVVDSSLDVTMRYRLDGAFGAVVSLDDAGWLRLRITKSRDSQLQFAASVSAQVAAVTVLPAEADALLAALLGTPELEPVVKLRDAILRQLRPALEQKLSADLRWSYDVADSSSALLDASFDFTPDGLRAYQDALAGRWDQLLCQPDEHVHLRQGALRSGLRRETHIELHLPFLERKEWNARLEALAKVEVVSGPDGRLLVYQVDAAERVAHEGLYQSALLLGGGRLVGGTQEESSFTLSYTDRRSRPPAEALAALSTLTSAYGFAPGVVEWLEGAISAGHPDTVETALTLAVPGPLVSAWLEVPAERDSDFFEVFSKVSVAVQTAMRRWLPYAYFHDIARYETLGAAFPLLLYQCSRPSPGQPRSDFTYDAMSERSMGQVYRSAARALPETIENVERLLIAAGRDGTARFYRPQQAPEILATVRRNPRQLNSLIVADAFYVDSLIKLGLAGRRVAAAMPGQPQKAVRELARFSADFVRTFHSRLRRLYASQDFVALGTLLLVEATHALGAAQGRRSVLRGTLRLRVGEREQTFVNADYGIVE